MTDLGARSTSDLLEELVLERHLTAPPGEREAAGAERDRIRAEIVRRADAASALPAAMERTSSASARDVHRALVRRAAAAGLLAESKDPAARAALVGLLHHARSDVRDAATQALVRRALSDDSGWSELLDARRPPPTLVSALRALVQRRSLGAAEPFVLALAAARVDGEVQKRLADALALGGAACLAALGAAARADPRNGNPAVDALVDSVARAKDVLGPFEDLAAAIGAAPADDAWILLDRTIARLMERGIVEQAASGDGERVFEDPRAMVDRARAWIAASRRPAEPPSLGDVVAHDDALIEVQKRGEGTTGRFPAFARHMSRALERRGAGRALHRALDSEARIEGAPAYRVACWRWHGDGEYNRVFRLGEEGERVSAPFGAPSRLDESWARASAASFAGLRPGRYLVAAAELDLRPDDGPPFSTLPWPYENEDEVDMPNAVAHFASAEVATAFGPAAIALLPTRAGAEADPVALVWRIPEELALLDHDKDAAPPHRLRFYGLMLQGTAALGAGRRRVLLVAPRTHAGDAERLVAFARAAR